MLLFSKKYDITVPKAKVPWLILAALVATAGNYASYGKTYYIPLGTGSGLAQSLFIVLTLLCAFAFTKDVTWLQLFTAIVCLTGVILVQQPKFIFKHHPNPLFNTSDGYITPCNAPVFDAAQTEHDWNSSRLFQSLNHDNDTTTSLKHDYVLGYTFVIIEATTWVIILYMVKYKLSEIDIIVYSFWVSVFGSAVSFIIMGLAEVPTLPEITVCILFMVAHMLTSSSHDLFFNYSYRIVPPANIAIITSLVIPGTFLLQYTFLSGMYPGYANAPEMAGFLLIFLGSVIVPAVDVVEQTCTSKMDY